MGLSASCSNAYLEPQQKEKSSVMFIEINRQQSNIFPTGINTMELGTPWDNAYL